MPAINIPGTSTRRHPVTGLLEETTPLRAWLGEGVNPQAFQVTYRFCSTLIEDGETIEHWIVEVLGTGIEVDCYFDSELRWWTASLNSHYRSDRSRYHAVAKVVMDTTTGDVATDAARAYRTLRG